MKLFVYLAAILLLSLQLAPSLAIVKKYPVVHKRLCGKKSYLPNIAKDGCKLIILKKWRVKCIAIGGKCLRDKCPYCKKCKVIKRHVCKVGVKVDKHYIKKFCVLKRKGLCGCKKVKYCPYYKKHDYGHIHKHCHGKWCHEH